MSEVAAKVWIRRPGAADVFEEFTVTTLEQLQRLLDLPDLTAQELESSDFRRSRRICLYTGFKDAIGVSLYEWDWVSIANDRGFDKPYYVRYWGTEHGYMLQLAGETIVLNAERAQQTERVQNYWNDTDDFYKTFQMAL